MKGKDKEGTLWGPHTVASPPTQELLCPVDPQSSQQRGATDKYLRLREVERQE